MHGSILRRLWDGRQRAPEAQRTSRWRKATGLSLKWRMSPGRDAGIHRWPAPLRGIRINLRMATSECRNLAGAFSGGGTEFFVQLRSGGKEVGERDGGREGAAQAVASFNEESPPAVWQGGDSPRGKVRWILPAVALRAGLRGVWPASTLGRLAGRSWVRRSSPAGF